MSTPPSYKPLTTLSESEANVAVEKFCTLLSFETVSSIAATNGAYQACGAWLLDYCREINVFDSVSYLPEAPENSPVVIAVWKGKDESLPVILLNAHYDVVPADASDWTVPPFGGRDSKRSIRIDEGNDPQPASASSMILIYGRGTQDMKCVVIQYLEALRKLKADDPNFQPTRTIVVSLVPDEEVGGAGMAAFLESTFYKQLPGIALALDEGLASTTETYSVFYGERIPWFIDVTAHGRTGHGSRFIEETAVEQIVALANKALAFRTGQRDKLMLGQHENCAHAVAAKNSKKQAIENNNGRNEKGMALGDVTSLNITTLEAGVKVGDTFAYNCVPPLAKCSLDIRITPHTDPKQIGDMLDQWCQECSHDDKNFKLEWSYIGRGHDTMEHALTSCDATVNPWYGIFEDAMSNMGLQIEPSVFPAATDSRFLRALGVRALGFSPMRSTTSVPCPILLHENDEYLPEPTFVEGIAVYVGIIHALATQDITE
ncbi:hypothetical protein MPSEU_000543000 [Mayamaea pseudoterrestris]|nr:hypothetical protein MPSEU_000543000 [Mayamaea pseudoterrestris]